MMAIEIPIPLYSIIEELNNISQSKPDYIENALNKFLNDNPDIKRAIVVNSYLDKKINLSKAAEELGLHRLELERQFESEGIPVRRISIKRIAWSGLSPAP